MTTQEIKALILTADPEAKRYQSSRDEDAFTVWAEFERIQPPGASFAELGWKFEVDRYTRTEDDTVAEAIERALREDVRVAYTYEVTYEMQTGYIRHIFVCEGV